MGCGASAEATRQPSLYHVESGSDAGHRRVTVVDSSPSFGRTETVDMTGSCSVVRPLRSVDLEVAGRLTESVDGSELDAFDEYDAALREHPNDAYSPKAFVLFADTQRDQQDREPEPMAREPPEHVIEARRQALVKRGVENGVNASPHQFVPAPEPSKNLRASLRSVRQWFRQNDEEEKRPQATSQLDVNAQRRLNGTSSASIVTTGTSASPSGVARVVTASDVTLSALPHWGDDTRESSTYIDLPGASGAEMRSVEATLPPPTSAETATPLPRLTESNLMLAHVAAKSVTPGLRDRL
eukprot:CAMPEP_0174828678 /NCGR_PEP_ID=MMETSP1114-20130205/1479_1 /TAXON_ID=312471 /ORGANISM="Neobodo designis, Strain CCAP 1951/1" /LENGTH=297 /DNA_ID=CAMNT_0016062401 /DNA_START=41 /DNA_END=934 /DNA_ORIENTATION=-